MAAIPQVSNPGLHARAIAMSNVADLLAIKVGRRRAGREDTTPGRTLELLEHCKDAVKALQRGRELRSSGGFDTDTIQLPKLYWAYNNQGGPEDFEHYLELLERYDDLDPQELVELHDYLSFIGKSVQHVGC